MSDTDDDALAAMPPPAKRRKFAFKKLAQRIAEVDVDVYRQLKAVREEPLPGCSSFFQEELLKWRELNTAEHWLLAAPQLQQRSETLPQLLHHKDEVVDILLGSLSLEARLSAPPLFCLLGTLARDLQADYLPHVPRVQAHLAALVQQGAESEPELLQPAFECLALVCKHLVRRLAADLPSVLRASARLRAHPAPHVRRLTAATLAYLLRQATTVQLRLGVRTLLAECVVAPSEERADGAGLLLAEAAKGVAHGLNSKAPQLLALLLQRAPVTAAELRGKARGGRQVDEAAVCEGVQRVAEAALGHLLEHVRRGKAQPLWDAALALADRELGALDASQPTEADLAAAARAVALVAQAAEFFRGSRVESYAPLFALAARLCRPELLAAAAAVEAGAAGEALVAATLRLLTAALAGHSKEVGASKGMRGVRAHAAEWAAVFTHVSGAPLVDFLGGLLQPPAGGAEVAAIFAPQALEALARRLLAGGREPGLHSRALAILLQYCRAAREEEALPEARPFLGACPSGAQLVKHLKGLLTAKVIASGEAATAAAFCALGCLPYSCSSAAEIAALCDGVVSRCEAGLAAAGADTGQVLTLLAAALRLKARVLLRAAEQEPGGPAGGQLAAMRGVALRWLKAHPAAFPAVEAAAAVLTAAKQTGHQAGAAELEELLPVLEGNLTSRSQPLRRESLRALTACEQPGGSDALERLLRIESAPLAIEAGRPGAASLEMLKAALEFGRVPPPLLGAVAAALLGVLNIRLLLLWTPANTALAAALKHAAPAAAPRVLAHLRAVQAAFLAGNGAAVSPEEDAEEAGDGDARLGEQTAERVLRRAADAGSPQRGSGATDASVRLNHLLQAVAKAPAAVLERFEGDWVPLFLAHVAARSTGVDREEDEPGPHEGVTQLSRIGGRAWRAHLKDWLAVVAAVKAPRSLRQAEQLRVAVASLLTDIDAGVQQATLKCLKAWKLKHVNEHLERLLRLVSNDTLREELTAFPLATSCADGISPEHRPGLVRVLTRVLWPKMRKRSGRLGGRGAPGSARAAVLNFLAAAQPPELATLLQLVLQPVSAAFEPPSAAATGAQATEDGLFEEPWWVRHLGREPAAFWLAAMQPGRLAAYEPRVKLGLLHSAEDLLQHLGHNMQPFLPELAALLLALLESAQGQAGKEGGDASAREVRAGSLRLLASLWARFPAATDFNALWPRLFALMQPSVQRMPAEASANRAPPALEVAAAFAASPALAPLLADRRSDAAATVEQLPSLLQAACNDAWADARCGSRLLGQVVAVLAAHTCGAASREACLALLEDVLGFGEEPAGLLLAPHMAALLDALRGVAVAEQGAQPAPPKRARAPGQKQKQPAQAPGRRPAAARALAILEQLSALPCSRDLCDRLADALLPLLRRKSGKRAAAVSREAMLARVLNVLTIVWQRQAANGDAGEVSEEKLLGIADSMGPLAGEITGARAATALAAAVQALAGLQPSLRPAAELLAQLSALSTTEVDAVDFDARLAAHRRLARGGWGEAAAGGGALLLVHRAFVDLRSGDDLAIRHAAAQALAALLPVAAPGDPALRAVQANLRRGVAAANLAVRQEHLTLLRALGLRFPADHPDLRALADDDVEVDFFANVAHLQMHRRTRALQRLARLLEARRLGAGVLLHVVTPLLAQMVVEGRAAEDAGHELKDSDRDKEANVADAAVRVLGKLGAALAWQQYRQLMGQFLRSLQRHAATSKAVVRAVCAIIDAFHFPLPAEADAAADPAAAAQPEQPEQPPLEPAAAEAGASDEDAEADAEEASEAAAADQQEVLRWLTKRVLPALEAALVVEKGESVRAPVALAIVKLVRRLPPAAARAALPRVLQGVANLLKHRAQRIRDDARAVLAAMAAELGPRYLPFLLDVLESALPEKGYLGHVKGYSLHFLLEALAKEAEPGAFDETLPRLLELVERQLFGEAAEEREAGAFAGVREGRKSRANDTYQLLAQCTTFRTQLAALLEPVRCRLADAAAPATRAKLAALLEAAARGVAANASATPQDTLVFVSGVLQSVTAAERAAVARAEAAADAASRGEGADPEQQQEAAAARHQHLLLHFALGLLLRALKRGALGGRSPEAAAMLDPLLPALVAALRSRHAPVVELSLRVLGHLVQLPLPGLASAAPAAGDAMADLMRAAPDAGGRVPQECLRLLAALLRACPQWAPRSAQLRFLLTWAFADVAAAAAASGAFTLLKAVIRRRLLLPEVYDVMDRVQDLMVKSQSQTARQLCSSTLLQFLLDYPLGAKRFQQHLHFLLANLAFEHEAGRLAALDLLAVLCGKLPPELLAAHASVVFVPLVARLPADPSPRCRKEAAAAIQSLVKLVPPEQARALLGFCAEWLAGGDARLRAAAAQALGLMAEAQGEAFGRSARPQLPRVAELLAAHAADEAGEGEALQDGEEAGAGQRAWQEAYHALVLLTRLARACPAQLRWREPAARPLWRALPGLLLHRHLWVRKLAADALGLAFADAAVWEGLLADAECGPDRLAALLYLQLEAPEAREAGLAQAAKCLVFLAPHLRPPGAAEVEAEAQAQAAADAESGGEGAEAAAEAAPAAPGGGPLERLSLIGLVRRVARLADDRSFPRRAARLTALRLLAALASRLGPAGAAPLLPLMLRPLFRVSEGLSPNPPEVRELAAEVLGHLRQAAGADALAAGLNEARRGVAAARAERRRQAAVRALVDPGAAARSKLQKQARKAAGRKRKLDEIARLRGAGLPAKNKRRRERPGVE